MNKKITAIWMAFMLIITMIVPAMAEGGDNTGDDNMPCSVVISNSTLLGAYTPGTEKVFKVSTYASTSEGKTVTRKIEISGESETSALEYKDGTVWKDISGYNTSVTLTNDIDREIRVTFNDTGVYSIVFTLTNTNNTEVARSKRKIIVTENNIALYVEPETTTVVETTPAETTTVDESTTPAETTTVDEPTTPDETTIVEGPTIPVETTTAEVESTTPAETTTAVETTESDETTADFETTTFDTTTVQETTTEKNTTVQPTTAKTVKIAKVKIKKATKKKNAKSARISLKKIKKVTGYQIQVSTSRKFKKKTIVKTKTFKKTKYTIRKLKAGKKYYVRARAYVKVKKIKVYGKWCKGKKISFIK